MCKRNRVANVLAQLNRNSIAYHLLTCRLRTNETESVRECLNFRSLAHRQRTGIVHATSVARVSRIALGDWTINPSNGWAWLVDGENSTASVTARVPVLDINVDIVTEPLADRHWLFVNDFFPILEHFFGMSRC